MKKFPRFYSHNAIGLAHSNPTLLRIHNPGLTVHLPQGELKDHYKFRNIQWSGVRWAIALMQVQLRGGDSSRPRI